MSFVSNRVSNSLAFALSLALPLAACSNGKKTTGPCARGELAACGAICSAVSTCPQGLSCDDGECYAECTAASANQDCGKDVLCSTGGQCESSKLSDGGLSKDATADGANSCDEVVLNTSPKTPNVILIIDQSASMGEPFGTSTRWKALKASLLASNGLIAQLQDRVRFGVSLYSSRNGTTAGGMCPLLTESTVELNNLVKISTLYQPADFIDDTPTGAAINAVLDKVLATPQLDPQAATDPTVFILATDGVPDTCAVPDGDTSDDLGMPESINAVKRAFAAGIRTYVIAVADEKDLPQAHVNDLANAGVGNTTSTPAPSFRPKSDQGLRDALSAIVGGVQSCDVALKGTVSAELLGAPCNAKITLGGKQVPCMGDDRFEFLNASTVSLKGASCTELKAGKALMTSFGCGQAVPLF